MSNIPKLRFPEFTGEWEEKKIDELSLINPKPDDLPEVFSYIDLESVKNGALLQEKKIKKKDAPSRAQRLLKENDILFQTVRPYQRNNYFFVSKTPTVASTGYAQFRVNKYNYPSFLYQYLYTNNFVRNVLDRCSGTSFPAISTNDLLEITLHIPSYHEQQKIADFLSNVDSIITAETKILNAFQKKKKALMQKLFTQQLRFKSDDGTDFPKWEEKRLISEFPFIRNGFVGTVTDFFTNKNEGVKYIEGTNIHNGIISNSINLFVTKEFHKTHKNSQLKENDILMVQSGHVGETAVVSKELENSNCHALIIMSNGGKCSSAYVNYYFQSREGKKQLSILTTGSTIKHILASDMQKFICPFPCLQEQQKIAACLSSMDSLIQTQQKVVTTWQQRKKALLQQMFI